MAITTNNEKLGVMEWCIPWETGIPLLPGAFGQDDKQQLIWGYPGVLWDVLVPPGVLSAAYLWRFRSIRGQNPPTS